MSYDRIPLVSVEALLKLPKTLQSQVLEFLRTMEPLSRATPYRTLEAVLSLCASPRTRDVGPSGIKAALNILRGARPMRVYEPLPLMDALAVRFASQHAAEPLWTEAEMPRVLRAVLNAKLVAKKGGRYASEYKWRMLGLASDCKKPHELAKLLRTEGITHSHLAAWRRQLDETGSFDDRRVVRRTKAINTAALSTRTDAPVPAGSAVFSV